MRRKVTSVALLIGLVGAPSGGADRSTRHAAWPGSTIAYVDLTRAAGYHGAVLAAVGAWNRAHVGIRFAASPARRAALAIVYRPGRCLSARAGTAPAGFQRSIARIVVRTCPQLLRPLLVAHELGLVLGLRDDDRSCSLMNSGGRSDGVSFALPARCSRWNPPVWLQQLVDPGSVAIARSIYSSPVGPVELRVAGVVTPRIAWRQPSHTPGARTVVLRGAGRCPTDVDLAGGSVPVVYDKAAFTGLHEAVDTRLPRAGGRYCYRVFTVNEFGRATRRPGTATFVLDLRPSAAFTIGTASPTAGVPVVFADTSTDPDGRIVHWRWDFGDPASGAAGVLDTTDVTVAIAPQHTYAQPGSYTVMLTVTDDDGRVASVSHPIFVAAPTPVAIP